MLRRPPGTQNWPFRATRAGQHRIEQVHPAMDGLEQVRRRAEPHQVARPRIVGEERDGDVERGVALLRGLVAGQPADADAIERQARDEPRRGGPQVRLEAALDDPEERLVRSRECAASERSAQRCVRSVASATTARGELGKTGWSKATAMSEPSASWTADRDLRA